MIAKRLDLSPTSLIGQLIQSMTPQEVTDALVSRLIDGHLAGKRAVFRPEQLTSIKGELAQLKARGFVEQETVFKLQMSSDG